MRPVILTFGIIFILFAIFFILFTAKEGTLKGLITGFLSGPKQIKQNAPSTNISNGATAIRVPLTIDLVKNTPDKNLSNQSVSGIMGIDNSASSNQTQDQSSNIYNVVSSNQSQFVPPFDPNQVDNQKLALNSCSTDAQCLVNQRCDLRIRVCIMAK